MKQQGNGRNAFGGDASGKAASVEASVAVFIQAEQAILSIIDNGDVFERTRLRRQAVAVKVDCIVLYVLSGAELLKIRDEFLRSFTDAG